MLKLVKVLMFNFYGNKELNHEIWEAYVPVLQCRQEKFEMNQEFLSVSGILRPSSSNMMDQSYRKRALSTTVDQRKTLRKVTGSWTGT